jgi:hypothetical protein
MQASARACGERDRASLQCTIMVYSGAMTTRKQVRRSLTLPSQIAKKVDRMAKRRRLSDNRVLVELIELGIEARQQKEKEFFELAERFRASKDPEEIKRLGEELGLFVFGE